MTLFDHGNLATILAILGILTGVYQLTLLLSVVLRGGTVTMWFGIVSAALWISYVLVI